MTWEKYRKTAEQEMRPYIPGEDLTGVSVSERDTLEQGGMIARGADDDALWYVSKRFYEENYKIVGRYCCSMDLDEVVDQIANLMKSKFDQKARSGYSGWENHSSIPDAALINKLLANARRKDWVDVANLAAILEYRAAQR